MAEREDITGRGDVTTTEDTHDTPTPPASGALSARGKVLVITAVIVLFAVIVGIRSTGGIGSDADVPPSEGQGAEQEGIDPVAAYEEALESDRPIYVLFHSKTCAPCVQIEGVAAEVLPDYAESITFVSVSTDDPRSRPLFSRFQFQFIPTSFFLAPDGTVADRHTGVLSEPQMRERLDSLVDLFGAEATSADTES